GVDVEINATPFDLGDSPPFAEDREHGTYDPDAVHRYWRVLAMTQRVLDRFRGGFAGKASPVQLFWHSFDLAHPRYSAPPPPPLPRAPRAGRGGPRPGRRRGGPPRGRRVRLLAGRRPPHPLPRLLQLHRPGAGRAARAPAAGRGGVARHRQRVARGAAVR